MNNDVFTIAALAVLAVICLKIFLKPIKFALKIALNVAFGFAALIIIDMLSEHTGVTIGVNWLNAAVVGLLGIPGAGLLLLIDWISTM